MINTKIRQFKPRYIVILHFYALIIEKYTNEFMNVSTIKKFRKIFLCQTTQFCVLAM